MSEQPLKKPSEDSIIPTQSVTEYVQEVDTQLPPIQPPPTSRAMVRVFTHQH